MTKGEKISAAKKGITTRKGFHLSEEHKRKIGEANQHTPKPHLHGDRNSQWKGGFKRCISCGEFIRHYGSTRIHRKCRTGIFHPRWRGASPLNERIRKSPEYKLWRKAVFERDNYTCIWCGAKNGNGKTIILNADHIKPFALFPELRFAIDNGRTLCRLCHEKTDTYGTH